MFCVELNWNFFHNIWRNFFLLAFSFIYCNRWNGLFLAILLFILFFRKYLLVVFSCLDLLTYYFTKICEKLLLKSFAESTQSVTYFYFDDLWSECYELIALKQNHSDLILSLLQARHEGFHRFLSTLKVYIFENHFSFRLCRGSAGVELVDNQTIIFVQTAPHFKFSPQLFQICQMTLF